MEAKYIESLPSMPGPFRTLATPYGSRSNANWSHVLRKGSYDGYHYAHDAVL